MNQENLLNKIRQKDAKAFTHGGKFHADDIFSSALLLYLNPEIQITRGNQVPEEYDGIVFDIGRGAYDHHQKDSRVRENGIPYAAFGLLWEELGTEILGEELAEKLKKYRHGLLLLYFPFYLAAFAYLEKKVPDKVHIINCAIDQYIPFVEVFIIPYLLWFAYVAVAGIYFFFKEKESFCKWMYFGMIGMTIFIIVSYLYPNGLELRPETFTRDNIFVQLTKMIYSMDTPTNVLPSIHVFNSMAVYFAVKNSPKLKNNKAVRTGAFVMTSLIILSTMFLKQHSVVDVLTALILSCLSYDFIYNERTEKIRDGLEELKFRRKRKEFSKY